MNSIYCIAITLGEFHAWFNAGELRGAADRAVAILPGDGRRPCLDSIAIQELLSRLPFVDLEEEHNVLVVVVDMANLAPAEVLELSESLGGGLRAVYLPISCLTSIHPLTDRGARLLSSRMEGYAIRLSEPLCEAGANSLWRAWLWRRALRGGGELLRTLVANTSYVPSPETIAEVRRAVEAHGSQPETECAATGLIAAALSYDRHKPISSSDIGYIVDLGVILKDRFGDDSTHSALIAGLRAFCRSKENGTDKLPDLINEKQFAKILAARDVKNAHLVIPLVLYLRWRYLAQKAGAITIGALLRDIREYSGKFPRAAIEEAIWLLGAYAGFDRLAKEIYLHQKSRYRFMAAPVPHEPITIDDYTPPIPVAVPTLPPEAESGSSVVDFSVAAVTGTPSPASPSPGEDSGQPPSPEPKATPATKPRKKRAKSTAKDKTTSKKDAGEGTPPGEFKLQ